MVFVRSLLFQADLWDKFEISFQSPWLSPPCGPSIRHLWQTQFQCLLGPFRCFLQVHLARDGQSKTLGTTFCDAQTQSFWTEQEVTCNQGMVLPLFAQPLVGEGPELSFARTFIPAVSCRWLVTGAGLCDGSVVSCSQSWLSPKPLPRHHGVAVMQMWEQMCSTDFRPKQTHPITHS